MDFSSKQVSGASRRIAWLSANVALASVWTNWIVIWSSVPTRPGCDLQGKKWERMDGWLDGWIVKVTWLTLTCNHHLVMINDLQLISTNCRLGRWSNYFLSAESVLGKQLDSNGNKSTVLSHFGCSWSACLGLLFIYLHVWLTARRCNPLLFPHW